MAQWYYQAVLDKTSLADCIAALQTWANTNLGSIHPYYTKLTVMQGSANQQPFGYLFYYANKLTEDGGKVTYTPAPLPGQGTVASHNSRNADWGWAYRDYAIAQQNDPTHAGDTYPQLVNQLTNDLNQMHLYDAQLAQVEFSRFQPPSGQWSIVLTLWWPQQTTYS